uniref:DNA repair protein REV1 n=1 Tax=Ciona savignyi TaxID=51511 RepID=H2ZFE8_CIOSA
SGMGGYMEAKIQKLEVQFQDKSCSNEQLSSIFNNVAIHVNGYTNPSCDELKTLMAKHGGKYHAYYSSNYTTHVIASNLPRAKSKDLKPNEKVVRPEWIVDSINAGKLLPIQAYLLVGSTTGSENQRTFNNISIFETSKNITQSRYKLLYYNFHYEVILLKCPYFLCYLSTEVFVPHVYSIIYCYYKLNKLTFSRNIAATTDSDFLKEFYANSRLHFISIWKNEMADFVRYLRIQLMGIFPKIYFVILVCHFFVFFIVYFHFYKKTCFQYFMVIHIDMDCFFVSVGLLSRPHLKGRPVAVTHHSNAPAKYQLIDIIKLFRFLISLVSFSISINGAFRLCNPTDTGNTLSSYSEIASCNYEARAAGLKNGMFYGKAKELCPDLVAIPYDFDAYKDVSNKLYTVLSSYTHTLEAVSCDEALLDVTQLVQECKLPPDTIAQHIRAKVQETTGCNASAGIGPNILQRMATRRGKPNGQHEVKLEEAEEFIRGNQLKDLPGVGHSTVFRLKELGVLTCYDLQQVSPQVLKNDFGNKTGQRLHELARGIDNTEVCQSKERKSVSADVNYGIRLTTHEELRIFLTNLAKEVTCRLKKINLSCKKVTLKVMVRHSDAPVEAAKFAHGICNSMSRSKNLDDYTDDFNIIMKETMALMLLLQLNICDLRGIGIQLS